MLTGLDNIYYLTRHNRKLSIYLEDHDSQSRTANYSTFYIDDSSTEYVNHVSIRLFTCHIRKSRPVHFVLISGNVSDMEYSAQYSKATLTRKLLF